MYNYREVVSVQELLGPNGVVSVQRSAKELLVSFVGCTEVKINSEGLYREAVSVQRSLL